MFERMRERRAVRLAVAVAVESLYALGQTVGQTVGRHPEAAPRGTGVVELDLYLRIFGVDAQPAAYRLARGLHPRVETFVLRERIERYMAAAPHDMIELVVGVSGRIGVCSAAELLARQARLVERAGRGGVYVFAEHGEGAPQRESLESEDDLGAALARHTAYERKVATQQTFLDYVARRRESAVIFGADIGIDHGMRINFNMQK